MNQATFSAYHKKHIKSSTCYRSTKLFKKKFRWKNVCSGTRNKQKFNTHWSTLKAQRSLPNISEIRMKETVSERVWIGEFYKYVSAQYLPPTNINMQSSRTSSKCFHDSLKSAASRGIKKSNICLFCFWRIFFIIMKTTGAFILLNHNKGMWIVEFLFWFVGLGFFSGLSSVLGRSLVHL